MKLFVALVWQFSFNFIKDLSPIWCTREFCSSYYQCDWPPNWLENCHTKGQHVSLHHYRVSTHNLDRLAESKIFRQITLLKLTSHANFILEKKRYFISKIVLTNCEKKIVLFSNWEKRMKFEAECWELSKT